MPCIARYCLYWLEEMPRQALDQLGKTLARYLKLKAQLLFCHKLPRF